MDKDKEKMIFDEFKKRMKGDMENEMYEDDNLFYRFLRARDFKIDNSEAMLRQHLKWRETYDIKNLSKWKPPEALVKHFLLPKIGYDKEGCIVKYFHFGDMDIRGILESCTMEEWIKFLAQFFEEDFQDLKRQTEKLGKTVDKVMYIDNLERFSLAKATDRKVLSCSITSLHTYLDNYPETMKAIYAINAPVYFSIFFNVLKAFLPSTVLKKIRVYSDDSWRKDLLEVIDADVLPAFLGGTRTDPDGNPLCLTILPNPEPVPDKYYLNKSSRSFPTLTDAKKAVVSRSAVYKVLVEVEEPGSHLEWEFELKSGDIEFGLFYEDDGGTKTELLPLQRKNTDEFIESGLYRCENAGSYTLVFDNSSSLFKTKELHYKVNVTYPEEEITYM